MMRRDREREPVPRDLRHRREILLRVVVHVPEHERDEHRHRDRREEERGAVGRRAPEGVDGNASSRAGPVVDDDRLPEAVAKGAGDQARGDVGLAAGGDGDEEPERLRARLRGRARRGGSGNCRREQQA